MKHFKVFIMANVAVGITGITADSPLEAAHAALNVVTPLQLDHLFDRQIDERVQTHFTEDIPAIMIDQYKTATPNAEDEPIETSWVLVDTPSDDAAIHAAAREVLAAYGEGENAFANDDLKAKMAALELALSNLPPTMEFTRTQAADAPEQEAE